jgi:hypothetical protein
MTEVILLSKGITDEMAGITENVVEELDINEQLKHIRQHCQMLERQLDVVGNVLLQQVHALQLLQEEE